MKKLLKKVMEQWGWFDKHGFFVIDPDDIRYFIIDAYNAILEESLPDEQAKDPN